MIVDYRLVYSYALYKPTIVSVSVEDAAKSNFVCVFDKNVADIIPSITAFTMSGFTIASVSRTGEKEITVVTNEEAEYEGEYTLVYTKPASQLVNRIEGEYNYIADSFSISVTNNLSASSAPVISTITIADGAPTIVVFTYDVALDETSEPATSAFTISGKTVSGVNVTGSTVEVTVTERYYWGDTGTAAYTAPESNMIKSLTGGEAISFEPTAITNNVALASATTTLIVAGRYTSAPTDALKALINKTLIDIEAYTGVSKADCFYVRGVHEALFASQNWAKNAHNCTLVNSPTFTAKVGFQGNSTTMYIDMNYNPFTEAQNYTLEAGTIIFMHPILGSVSGRAPFGAQDNVEGRRNYILYYTNPITRAYMNTNVYNGNANMLVNNYFATTRSAGVLQGYLDGIASGDARVSAAEASLVNLNQFELGNNVNGLPSSLTNAQTSFFWQGGLLTQTQILGITNVMKYFYANVGSTF